MVAHRDIVWMVGEMHVWNRHAVLILGLGME